MGSVSLPPGRSGKRTATEQHRWSDLVAVGAWPPGGGNQAGTDQAPPGFSDPLMLKPAFVFLALALFDKIVAIR
jgi:hypothetical protein